MTARTLITGLGLVESPRWHDGRLWFADWSAGQIIALADDGASEVIVEVAALPLCFGFQGDGEALIVANGEEGRRLLRRRDDGTVVPQADLGAVESTFPWNDIAVTSGGTAFVNNIGFDFGAGDPAPGFVAVATPDGAIRTVADELLFPNGMVVTPDDATLIVAESYGGRLTAFDIAADGGLSGRRVWAELPGAAPDGICLDPDGAIWYADVPAQHCRRVAEGGEVLDTVDLDRGCFACALGGPAGRTLYVTAAEFPAVYLEGPGSGEVVAVDLT